jgi:hypothetical protein
MTIYMKVMAQGGMRRAEEREESEEGDKKRIRQEQIPFPPLDPRLAATFLGIQPPPVPINRFFGTFTRSPLPDAVPEVMQLINDFQNLRVSAPLPPEVARAKFVNLLLVLRQKLTPESRDTPGYLLPLNPLEPLPAQMDQLLGSPYWRNPECANFVEQAFLAYRFVSGGLSREQCLYLRQCAHDRTAQFLLRQGEDTTSTFAQREQRIYSFYFESPINFQEEPPIPLYQPQTPLSLEVAVALLEQARTYSSDALKAISRGEAIPIRKPDQDVREQSAQIMQLFNHIIVEYLRSFAGTPQESAARETALLVTNYNLLQDPTFCPRYLANVDAPNSITKTILSLIGLRNLAVNQQGLASLTLMQAANWNAGPRFNAGLSATLAITGNVVDLETRIGARTDAEALQEASVTFGVPIRLVGVVRGATPLWKRITFLKQVEYFIGLPDYRVVVESMIVAPLMAVVLFLRESQNPGFNIEKWVDARISTRCFNDKGETLKAAYKEVMTARVQADFAMSDLFNHDEFSTWIDQVRGYEAFTLIGQDAKDLTPDQLKVKNTVLDEFKTLCSKVTGFSLDQLKTKTISNPQSEKVELMDRDEVFERMIGVLAAY